MRRMIRPRAFIILFKDLHVWSVGSFFKLKWQWPSEYIKPLSAAIRRKNDLADKAKYLSGELKLVTLHFDGSMVSRATNGKNDFKGNLYAAVAGDVVYSKIDVRNGAIGIVPEDMPCVAVSSEFPVYKVNCETALPQYIKLLFRTEYFRKAINSMISGASGRKRVQPSQLESLKIPLPPLPVQQAIVERWQKAQDEIRNAAERIIRLNKAVVENALKDAGIEIRPLENHPKSFFINWGELEKWGVEFNRWRWNLDELLFSYKYPMVLLSDEAFVNPTNNVLLSDDELVSFVPMEAVSDKAGEIVSPQVQKYREVKSGHTRFSNDDVIWAKITPCMQNGKCAVARNLENGIGFGSTEFHVIRSKDTSRLLPDYIWSLLRLDHLRQAAQRYFIGSAGQQRVPVEFLQNLQIPLPPISIQTEIVNRINKVNFEITREREAAERKTTEIKAEIEALILGTKKMEEQ